MSASAEASLDLSEALARARNGDRHAVEAVLTAIAPSVHRFARSMCKNAPDADDVLQDTLINVARYLGDFEGRSSLSSWVFAITRSVCLKRRRGLKNRPAAEEAEGERPDLSPSPEARVGDRELASAIRTGLESLPEDHREVLVLRDIEGLSAPEAAASLGISVDAVKSRLHRARTSLREALRPWLEPRSDLPPGSPGCPNVAALWSKKLEGDLSPGDCSAMEKHIQTCASCGAACDALKRALLACQRVRTETVPPEVQARVKAAVRAWTATP